MVNTEFKEICEFVIAGGDENDPSFGCKVLNICVQCTMHCYTVLFDFSRSRVSGHL